MGPRAQLKLEKVKFFFPLHGRLSLGANTAVFSLVVMSGRFSSFELLLFSGHGAQNKTEGNKKEDACQEIHQLDVLTSAASALSAHKSPSLVSRRGILMSQRARRGAEHFLCKHRGDFLPVIQNVGFL